MRKFLLALVAMMAVGFGGVALSQSGICIQCLAPALLPLLGTEYVPCSQGGATVRCPYFSSVLDIRAFGLTSNPINLYISQLGNDGGSPGSGTNLCIYIAQPCLTKAQAVNSAFLFNAAGGNIIIHALAGGTNTWNESVFVNSPLLGSANSFPNPTIAPPAVQDSGQLIFDGGGTENWNGGSADCATIGVGDHATVAIMNMALISGTGSGCSSTGFVQIGGTLNLLAGNTWGPATVAIWHNENSGSNLGIWADQNVSGNATFLSVSGSGASSLISAGHLNFVGNPTLGTLFYVEASITQINPANIFQGTAVVTDEYQVKYGGQLLFYLTQSPQWPGGGGTGFLYSGGRINNASDDSYNTPCVAGNVGCPLTSPSPTGNVTVSVVDGSGPYAGKVDILAGASAAATGSFYLSFPSILVSDTGLNGLCSFTLAIGGPSPGVWPSFNAGSFTVYSFVRGADDTIGPASHVAFLWASPVVLPAGDYLVKYNCNN
jgi:hypothetical protein